MAHSNNNSKPKTCQDDFGTAVARDFYDDTDAQQFYQQIWGVETVHIGRYDLLTDEERASSMDRQQQIVRAQEHQEAEFLQLIRTKIGKDKKIRVLDMGCGYGGLLRRLWEAGMLTAATGVDIASQMCQHAREMNEEIGCANAITIQEESFLETSVTSQSVDLVVSMEALLHVGPEGQPKAVQEAARVLKPGGWIIFTDIMQQEDVDKEEMQPIYNRLYLSGMNTVSSYKKALESAGFTNFEFLPHSSNLAGHYGSVLEVLQEKGDILGLSKEFQGRMKAGLVVWRELAPKNLVWGFVLAQKNTTLMS